MQWQERPSTWGLFVGLATAAAAAVIRLFSPNLD